MVNYARKDTIPEPSKLREGVFRRLRKIMALFVTFLRKFDKLSRNLGKKPFAAKKLRYLTILICEIYSHPLARISADFGVRTRLDFRNRFIRFWFSFVPTENLFWGVRASCCIFSRKKLNITFLNSRNRFGNDSQKILSAFVSLCRVFP